MYLVLTALLALNVSAEIFNAFKMVDKGLVKSNTALDDKNNAVPELIREAAKKQKSLGVYAEKIDPIREKSAEIVDFIEGMKKSMIDVQGYKTDPQTGLQELVGKKDKEITTRMLVYDGKGEQLKAKLEQYRTDILELIDEEDREAFTKEIAVQIDEDTWKAKGKKSWAEMNFKQMPLQAVLPIFTKFINDVKSTEAAALNNLATKVGAGDTKVVLDKYTVVSAADKSYIIKGEKYRTEVFLSAAASADSQTGISVSVDGRKLPLNSEGVGVYETTPSSLGKKSYTASASIKNPVTGEVKSYDKKFSYEVGERSVTVSPLKMNVFYIGVENPVAVTAAGVASNDIKVSMGGAGGGSINKSGGNYVVKVTKPTRKGEFAKINVKAPGLTESRDFRVKRIPDPIPKLGKDRGGAMPSGQFKAQPGVFPVLEGFDFDAKCNITEFVVVRAPKRQDVEIKRNKAGKYTGEVAGLIKKAKAGDRYFFENIKCKCPGDAASRNIGQMVFNIK
jgi:gliding motility-associated protein GldM